MKISDQPTLQFVPKIIIIRTKIYLYYLNKLYKQQLPRFRFIKKNQYYLHSVVHPAFYRLSQECNVV